MLETLFSKLLSGNILYYPGCSTKFVAKSVEQKYKELLNKLGIEYITLKDLEHCCGSPILNAGYKEDFVKLAKYNLKLFKERGVSQIITNCPGCYLHFKKVYKEYLGEEWNIKVEFLLNVLWDNVQKSKVKLKKQKGVVTYHDPCHLGRAMGEYDIPRRLLEASNYTIKEMKFNKEYSLCCGAGGTVNINSADLSSQMGKERLRLAEETNAEYLVSPCVLCHYQFKANLEKNNNIKVVEFSELIDLE